MKIEREIHENSVTLALAEIDRLERGRASFTSAKRAAGEQLERQAVELGELRERLLVERTRAWSRTRREHDHRREGLEHARAMDAARAELEHRERLAVYAAELESKRRQLAELEATPTLEHPGRRVLKWATPAAATVLVAFFAILAVGEGEDDAVARGSASSDALASQAAELEPGPTAVVDVESEVAPAAVVDAEPEPVAAVPEPERPKPVHTKPVTPKPPKTPKNPNPLTLLDPNGDPLG